MCIARHDHVDAEQTGHATLSCPLTGALPSMASHEAQQEMQLVRNQVVMLMVVRLAAEQ